VAPTVVNGRVYVGSDDGFAYCLDASNGSLIWKVRAAHRPDEVLGSGKMVSLWPIRTGVLVDDGVAYFGAGVFPHERTFVCAVDANTGEFLWRNDAFSQRGYALEFGGITPQGALLASDSTVFMPSGRAMPAAFSRENGSLLYYCSPGGKIGGTWALLTGNRLVAGIEGKRAYDAETGRPALDNAYAWFPGLHLVATEQYAFMVKFDELCALDRQAFQQASEWRDRVASERGVVEAQLKQVADRQRNATPDQKIELDSQAATYEKQLEYLSQQQRLIEDAVHKWRRPCKQQHALIKAGETLFLGGDHEVTAASAVTGDQVWSVQVDGMACGLAAANRRLFVSTDQGTIYCFSEGNGNGKQLKRAISDSPYRKDQLTAVYEQAAEVILRESGVTKGFCLVYGSERGRLAYELARRSHLNIVGIDPSPEKVAAAREALDAAGLYGDRVTFDVGSLAALPYSDYFANLIVSDTLLTTKEVPGEFDHFMRVLKPCGGVLCLGSPSASGFDIQAAKTAFAAACGAPQVSDDKHWILYTRGPLEGAGSWTHQYADPGNTACSEDRLVKGPLGVLWYGRPGPERMVERHARAAAPLALDGRMFVQGEHVVMAYDSYNGVLLWQRETPGALRVRVDSDMSNMAVQPEGLYVATHDKCLRLDPATGETIQTYALPPDPDGNPRRWGYLACIGDTIYGSSARPLDADYGLEWWRHVQGDSEETPPTEDVAELLVAERAPNPRDFWTYEYAGKMWRSMSSWPAWGSVATPVGAVTSRIMASNAVFALDRETGEPRWVHRGQNIAHPAITIGDSVVFLAECSVSAEEFDQAIQDRQALIDKGTFVPSHVPFAKSHADVRRVFALNARTGEKQWERVVDLTECGGDRMGMAYRDGLVYFFGCFSNHDRFLFRDGELKWRRITALSAKDGSVVWSRPLNYLRRPVIVEDEILIEPRACSAKTGEIKRRLHPLTGEDSTWEFVRPGHCCSITSACPNMFFLRGYFLWYYDMEMDQGMLPFGGIRPGCWLNMLPADGLLLFPEASAGCTCSYPIRSTVVMQPKPTQRTWAMCVQNGNMTPVKHMAINFGAPGDWRADDGTLWFSYPHPPSTSWYSYGVNFRLEETFAEGLAQGTPGTPHGEKFFCRDFEGIDVAGTDKPWIFASGSLGMTSCVLPLLGEADSPATYKVRLYFVETTHDQPKQRMFRVKLQGKTVDRNLDIFAEAGGAHVALVKEFEGVEVTDGLRIDLIPHEKEPTTDQLPVLNGVEVIRESVQVAAAP
jgi:outer membrane protein assembly factor BamB